MNDTVKKVLMEAVEKITEAAMAAARQQVREEFIALLVTPVAQPPRAFPAKPISKLAKARKKGPIQLCPAPGCKERSAPVFGMMCKKHKDVPKATVLKWREARRKKNGN